MEDVRLIQGDCVEVMRGLDAASIDAIVTDPPFGISYDPGSQPCGGRQTRSSYQVKWEPIAGDSRPDGAWLGEALRDLKDGSALYLITRWDVEPRWRELLREAGFRVNQRLTWHKRVSGMGDLQGTYAPTCEDILFASKGRHLLNGRPSMLLDVGCVPTWERRHHPHQKPVALPKTLIMASTQPGDLVLDPFVGSGTTLVACLKSGRRGLGIETHPGYVAAARRRIREAETPLFGAIGTV